MKRILLGTMALALAAVLEGRDEEAFADDRPLQSLEDAALGAGVHLDALFLEEHGADFGSESLSLSQCDARRGGRWSAE